MPPYLFFLVELLDKAQLEIYLVIISHFSDLRLSPDKHMKNCVYKTL